MGFGILKRMLPLLKAGLLSILDASRLMLVEYRESSIEPVRADPGRHQESRRRISRGANMNEVAMLRGAEPREILQTVVEKKVPAVMSYLSKRKWHIAKVLLTNLGANRLDVRILPQKKSPVGNAGLGRPGRRPGPDQTRLRRAGLDQTRLRRDIRVNQPVGISLKYEYGKFIFESKVVALEPSPEVTHPSGILDTRCSMPEKRESRMTIVLAVPDRIEVVQRRSYFRVDVPESLKVNVLLWHRGQQNGLDTRYQMLDARKTRIENDPYWQGKLVDISAGGAQLAVDTAQKPDFKKGQFIGLRFTPMPYERPLMFNAQIRNILPTADGKSICIGLQIVGLEASPEGHQVLSRLLGIVERYYQINQSSVKQQDMRATSS